MRQPRERVKAALLLLSRSFPFWRIAAQSVCWDQLSRVRVAVAVGAVEALSSSGFALQSASRRYACLGAIGVDANHQDTQATAELSNRRREEQQQIE